MAPGALGELCQVMPNLPQDTCQGCQLAEAHSWKMVECTQIHLHQGVSLSSGRSAPHSLLLRTRRNLEGNA